MLKTFLDVLLIFYKNLQVHLMGRSNKFPKHEMFKTISFTIQNVVTFALINEFLYTTFLI